MLAAFCLAETPNSGLTYYDGEGTLSAYKTHDRDPVLFADGVELVWRNGEDTTGCGDTQHCPNQYCAPGQDAAEEGEGQGEGDTSYHPAHYEILTYVYEWPAAGSVAQPLGKEQAGQDGVHWLEWLGERGWLDASAVAQASERLVAGDSALLTIVGAYSDGAAGVGEWGEKKGQRGARQVARLL